MKLATADTNLLFLHRLFFAHLVYLMLLQLMLLLRTTLLALTVVLDLASRPAYISVGTAMTSV